MKPQTIFKRYEIKYLVTEDQQNELTDLMKDYMQNDEYGKSTISNIYFDTPKNLLIRRSIEKPIYKEKLRLRTYNCAAPDSKVFVELKKKYYSVVYKRRISMPYSEAMNYLCDGVKPQKGGQILNEIDYFRNYYDGLAPKMFICYDREAFYSKTDRNFRMTFDDNILYREYDLSLTSDCYGNPLLPEGTSLLEVKTSGSVPLWLTHFLTENEIYQTSFSKYGNAYLKAMKAQKGVNSYAR